MTKNKKILWKEIWGVCETLPGIFQGKELKKSELGYNNNQLGIIGRVTVNYVSEFSGAFPIETAVKIIGEKVCEAFANHEKSIIYG
jgi:hypothetical protein